MAFSKNLRNIRREKNLSQEQLAELLNVSRQSVSKWEQDNGYPETEKLIQLAQKLDISLDILLLDKEPETILAKTQTTTFLGERKITIQSYDEKLVVTVNKLQISPIMLSGKNEPKFCIVANLDKAIEFYPTTLGYYKDEEDAKKELNEIYEAMKNGETTYKLKYYINVEVKWYGAKIKKQNDE